MTTALFTGFGLGFLVAAQVGPIWLLAARSVILGRFATGIMIGLGAATIDMAYGALGLAGAASLLRITGLRLGLGLLGAAVLTILGARALRNADPRGESGRTIHRDHLRPPRLPHGAQRHRSQPLDHRVLGRHIRRSLRRPHQPHHYRRRTPAGRHRPGHSKLVHHLVHRHDPRAPTRRTAHPPGHRRHLRPGPDRLRHPPGLAHHCGSIALAAATSIQQTSSGRRRAQKTHAPPRHPRTSTA